MKSRKSVETMNLFERIFGVSSRRVEQHPANAWLAGRLERRVMLDGDGVEAAGDSSGVVMVSSLEQQVVENRGSIIFVDAGVEDAQTLLDGLDPNVAMHAEVVLLDAGESGIAQVSKVLATRKNIGSLHFVTHGTTGEIQLGSDTVNQSKLEECSSDVQKWSRALGQDADILLYGCDVADGVDGDRFVRYLAALTDADVAASVDKTGSPANLADWDLEKQVGIVETQLAFSQNARTNFSEVLVVVDFESRSLGNQGPNFTDSGFVFSDGGWESSDLIIYGGDRGYSSQVLHPDNYSRTVTVERADGTTFDMASFDYAAGRFSSTDANVTGFLANGSTVTSNFASSSRSLETLDLNWSDLDRVVIDFRGGSNEVFGALDNFDVTQGGDPAGDAVLSFADSSPLVGEGDGTASITVVRAGNTAAPVSVDIGTSDGTAVGTIDYLPNSNRLEFAGGETSKTFDVTLFDDNDVEPTETFSVILSSPSVGATIANAFATVSLADNDTPANANVDDFEEFSQLINVGPLSGGVLTPDGFLFEDANPDANGALRFYGPDQGYSSTVLHSENWDRTIRMVREDGGAFDLQSFDYAAGIWNTPTDALVIGKFAGGGTETRSIQTSTKDFSTMVTNWTGLEWVEIDFGFRPSLPGSTSAYGALDNFRTNSDTAQDGIFSFAGSSQTLGEGNGQVTLEVTRSSSGSPASVDIATVSGSATAPQDFVASSTRLDFGVGVTRQLFVIDLNDDADIEGDEQFTVELSSPSTGNTIANGVFTVSIIDNDGAPTETTIDFDELTIGASSAVISQGFSFTDDGPGGIGNVRIYGPEADYTSNVLHSDNFARIIRMERVDGQTFDLSSFDYGAGRWNAQTDATVTGYLADGSTLTSSFLSASKTLSTSVLNWTGLQRVEIDFAGGASTTYGALDNFVIGQGTQGTPGTIGVPQNLVVEENQSNFSLPIERQNGSDGVVTVDYVINPSSAEEGLDYTAVYAGTISFADGQTSQNLPISITNDGVPEFGEFFSVEISNPTGGATIGNVIAEIDIVDDDPLSGVVYAEDFEGPNSDWTSNPFGNDTSESGAWEQATPVGATGFQGRIGQTGITTSGRQSLVTGAAPSIINETTVFYGGVRGTASVISPSISLPQGSLELTFNYNKGYAFFPGGFEISILAGGTSQVIFSDPIGSNQSDGTWISQVFDLSEFAGQSIQIFALGTSQVSSQLEAALDDVVIRST